MRKESVAQMKLFDKKKLKLDAAMSILIEDTVIIE